MSPEQWAELEEKTWASAVPHLLDPLAEAHFDACEAVRNVRPITPEDLRDLFETLAGNPSYEGPVSVRVPKDSRWYELVFQSEELDAIDYSETSNISIVDEDPDFPAIVRLAKTRLDYIRGSYSPATYPMTREVLDAIKEDP